MEILKIITDWLGNEENFESVREYRMSTDEYFRYSKNNEIVLIKDIPFYISDGEISRVAVEDHVAPTHIREVVEGGVIIY